MAELEAETIERAMRWCAEAGRQATSAEVRAALAPLGWDQLLAVRALLADPPPARPLGPQALADLSRGVPADLAAEREREGRYPRPAAVPEPPAAPTRPGAAPRKKGGGRSRRSQVVVRKAAPAAPAASPPPPRLPLFETLLLPAGRSDLERLIRRHGGRRPRLVAAMAATHRRADGAPLGDAEFDAALEHHGLERAFARRERDELVHAVRAAGAVLAGAAAALGHDLAGLGTAIARLGLDAEVKRLREARRRDLRTRATLAERALLLVGSGDTLADLGLLEEFERDLKKRLPEHLRALAGTGEPLELGLARSLALPGATVRPLLARLGVELRAPAPATSRTVPARRQPGRTTPARPTSGRPTTTARPAPGRGGAVHRPERPPTGDRPRGARPGRGPFPGARPAAPRPPGSRPATGRSGPARPRRSGPPGAGAGRVRPAGPRRPRPPGGGRGPGR